MNGFGNWFRNLMGKLGAGMARFMAGRYGTDKLNLTILGAGVVICLVSMFILHPIVNSLLTLLAYGLMILAIFRSFSRNTYKRYQENRRFLQFFERIKDRDHKYFNCPRCRQTVRLPRHKGKIAITCPKCKERFIRKT